MTPHLAHGGWAVTACILWLAGPITLLLVAGDIISDVPTQSMPMPFLIPSNTVHWWLQTHTPAYTTQAVALARAHRNSLTGVYMYAGVSVGANGSVTAPSDATLASKIHPLRALNLTVGVAVGVLQDAIVDGTATHAAPTLAAMAARNGLTSLMVDYEPSTDITSEHARRYAHFIETLAAALHERDVQLGMCVSSWGILTNFSLYAAT